MTQSPDSWAEPLYGFHGRYLRVDLTTGHFQSVAIDREIFERFLGGVGLGTWILLNESPENYDPLGPEAPLVFAFSPLVGTPLTTSAKFAVVAKSPLTGMISDALSSSHFAIQGKKLGVDAICIVGQAQAPVIIDSGRVEATDLWGETPEVVTEKLSSRGRVATIGVAGENLVRYATITNDGRHAGRGGLGAVMGSKRLKAIVVKGGEGTRLFDTAGTIAIASDLSKRSLGRGTAKYRELGTLANLVAFNRLETLPTRNFQAGQFEEASRLSPEALESERDKTRKSCAACSIGCEHIYSVGNHRVRMEYENMFALGPLCGVSDPDIVLEASRRCDEWGLDTISTGGTIAFAMECGERGLLKDAPRFGDGERLLETIAAIGARQPGLGELLSRGSRSVAREIGGDAIDFAPQVKGLELPGYDPRSLQTLALGFAVGTRGADHNKSGAYELDFSAEVDRFFGTPEAAVKSLETEDRAALFDSLILCKFLRGVFEEVWEESAAMLRAITGFEVDAMSLRETARRIVALKKAFNIREGWQPEDDTLPERFLGTAGPERGERLIPRERLQGMVRAYNLARGWTIDGYLPESVLTELGLEPKRFTSRQTR